MLLTSHTLGRPSITTAELGHSGLSQTVASTAVGTSLFATISGSADTRLIAFAAVLSIAAAVAAALQTTLNYGELASRHRAAASGYGDLRREAEQLIEFGAPDLQAPMEKIQQSWHGLEGDSPSIPQKIFDLARESISDLTAANQPS